MNSNKQIARFAGIGYLIIFITGIYANFFVIEALISPGDAATTANNISANQSLFRLGLFSFVIMVVFDVFLAWALYVLLKPVNDHLSLFSGWLRLVNSTVFAIALFNLLDVLQLLGGAGFPDAFTQEQVQAKVMLSLGSFNSTWLIGLVFFGLHLLLLGYLIIKSGYMPKFIGILLFIAAIGYLIDSFANFLLPDYGDYKDIFSMIVIIPGIVGELSFTFWLLLKGNKIPQT